MPEWEDMEIKVNALLEEKSEMARKIDSLKEDLLSKVPQIL